MKVNCKYCNTEMKYKYNQRVYNEEIEIYNCPKCNTIFERHFDIKCLYGFGKWINLETNDSELCDLKGIKHKNNLWDR